MVAMARTPAPVLVSGPVPEMVVPGVPVETIFSVLTVVYERVPPPVPRVMVMAGLTNDPLAPVFTSCMVPPLMRTVEPELAAIFNELGMENIAPLLIVTVPVPMVTAAPDSETVPSSTVIPPAVRAEGTLIVNAFVASVPAEKIATSPVAKVVVAKDPVESVVQFRPVVFHVPVLVPCPEPGAAPFTSHHLLAA